MAEWSTHVQRMTQPLAISAWIEDIKLGFRPCVCCGQFNIGPDEPAWKTRCSHCFMEFKNTAGQGDVVMVQSEDSTALRPKTEPFKISLRGNAEHCRECGTEIPRERREYALRVSSGKNEALKCYDCKNGITKPCEKCKQIHPAWWTDHPSHP